MDSQADADKKAPAVVDSHDIESNAVGDVAVGQVIEAKRKHPWTLSTFYRSVLFQMILFGA